MAQTSAHKKSFRFGARGPFTTAGFGRLGNGSRRGENMMAFLEQDEIDALDRQEILQNIEEGG
jgi:hypothetical protein